jgi:hypothetical protein
MREEVTIKAQLIASGEKAIKANMSVKHLYDRVGAGKMQSKVTPTSEQREQPS